MPKQSVKPTDPVHIKELKPDERNLRSHNPRNIGMIADAMQEVGAARSIVIDEDGTILAGNGAVEAAGQAGITKVKVVDVDGETLVAVRRKGLTARQKKRLAAFDNRTSDLSTWDKDAIRIQIESDAKMFDEIFRNGELEDLISDRELAELHPKAIGGDKSIFQLKHNVYFDSSNKEGIPDLLTTKMYNPPLQIETAHSRMNANAEVAFWNWRNGKPACMRLERTILGFYTYDAKFEDVWFKAAEIAERFLDQKWIALVTPNFSLLPEEPRILHKWNTYRSRWCGRYWQEIGFDIIPDVEWTDIESLDYSLLGIPKSIPAIAIQVHTRIKNEYEHRNRVLGIVEACKRIEPEKLLLYGGGCMINELSELIPDVKIVNVESQNQAIKRKAKGN